MNPIYIIIANKHTRIQMRCPQGRKLNESCAMRWPTRMTVVEDSPFFRCIYWCVGVCTNHKRNNEARLFDYTDDSQRAKLGRGDEIFNLPGFVRCIPWPDCTSRENAYSQFKTRYKFTVDFWMEFMKTIIVQGIILYFTYLSIFVIPLI